MSTELTIPDKGLQATIYRQERELTERADAETCQQVAEMIVGSYPNANPADPATYMRALRTVLAGYPASVVAQIANPRTGIVTKCRFPPTVAEIEEFAEPLMERMRSKLGRDREVMKSLEYVHHGPSPEQHKEIAEKFDAWASEMKARLERERAENVTRIQERFEATQCAPGEAIRASGLVSLDDTEQEGEG